MLRFKIAEHGDEKLVLEYIKKLARYEELESEVVGTTQGVIDNIFNKNVAKVLFAIDLNDNIVGFSLYFFNLSTFNVKPGLYIEDLFIDEAYRGLGYGTEFFDYYKKLAIKEGCGRIEWICLDNNTPAIEFYENKLGAVPMSDWTVRRLENL